MKCQSSNGKWELQRAGQLIHSGLIFTLCTGVNYGQNIVVQSRPTQVAVVNSALPLAALCPLCLRGRVTEFAPMGLLPLIASDLGITIPTAGLLVTGYAVGVMLGAPVVTLLTLRIPRKLLLLLLMGIFTVGNCLAFMSINYSTLLAARLVTSPLPWCAVWVGSMVAASFVPAGSVLGLLQPCSWDSQLPTSAECRSPRGSARLQDGALPSWVSRGWGLLR